MMRVLAFAFLTIRLPLIVAYFFLNTVSRVIIHNKEHDRGHDCTMVRAGQATIHGLERIQGSFTSEYSTRSQFESA